MKWFRLYSCVLDDPKVQQLSPALFKHWINLLCLANEHEPRGELPPLKDIAFRLRIKPSEAAKVMRQLTEARLIDGENASENRRAFPHNWPQRQRASDDVSTRVAEHRKRKARNDADSDTGAIRNVTLQVTGVKRREEEEEDTDTDTDTEENTLLSGKSNNTTAEEDAHPRAAAAASGSENTWTELEARRLAKRIAGKLKLTNPDIEGLMAVLCQHRYAPPWLEAEAATCVEWYSGKKRKPDIRGFNNWLTKAEQRHREAALHEHEREANSSNGHHTTPTTPSEGNGTGNGAAPHDPGADLYEFNRRMAQERERNRAEMVQ